MNSRSPQKKVGDFRPIVSPVTGAVLSIEAYAGRVHGRKLRRRFKLSHYGSVKWAQAAAESWVQEVTEERVDNQRAFLSLTPGMREECVEAIEMLRPYRLSIAEAVRTYVLPELKEKKAWPILGPSARPLTPYSNSSDSIRRASIIFGASKAT